MRKIHKHQNDVALSYCLPIDIVNCRDVGGIEPTQPFGLAELLFEIKINLNEVLLHLLEDIVVGLGTDTVDERGVGLLLILQNQIEPIPIILLLVVLQPHRAHIDPVLHILGQLMTLLVISPGTLAMKQTHLPLRARTQLSRLDLLLTH